MAAAIDGRGDAFRRSQDHIERALLYGQPQSTPNRGRPSLAPLDLQVCLRSSHDWVGCCGARSDPPSIAERAAAPFSSIPSLSPPLLSHPTFLVYHRIATDPCPLLLPFSACVLTQRVSSGPGTPAEASPRGKSSPGMLNPGTPGHHHSQLVGLSGRQMSTEASQERVRRAPHPHCFI